MANIKPRVKVPKTAEIGEIIEIKTLISHPMHSGRGTDGNGNLIPRNIINSFNVEFNGKLILSVMLKPSISSNPFFIFPCKMHQSGVFDFKWIEDSGAEFNISKKIEVS